MKALLKLMRHALYAFVLANLLLALVQVLLNWYAFLFSNSVGNSIYIMLTILTIAFMLLLIKEES